MDVETVVLKQLGRMLALGTPIDDADSVMFGSYRLGETERSLGGDDIAGVQYLYPDSACDAPTEPGRICCQGSEAVCDGCDDWGTVEDCR